MLSDKQGICIHSRIGMLFTSVLFLFFASRVAAQSTEFPPKRSHSLQTGSFQSTIFSGDTLTIVAVRVAFQPDNNRFTTGNGTFDPESLPYLKKNSITIDPLPHNRLYFESHLQFAKNYYETVSGGEIIIEYRVLPQVYQLPADMAEYSPTGSSFTYEKLAMLVRDTWQEVEELGGFNTGDLDPDKTAFAIFHAGVGRDIELTGTALDKTPQDIPSIYLDRNSLSDLLDLPSFQGFPINDGAFHVTNSMIMPRTLSRRGEDFTGNEFVLQLSINGLLAASIGSYLGLPDLFNTETGASGIGRFGLMDGESFFSYHGLFPPEPSAWEKLYMGWQIPFPISLTANTPFSLPAASMHQAGSVGKFDLSTDEYFLVENRHRDPDDDGATLTIRKSDGSQVQQKFTNSDETFVNQGEGFAGLLVPGVVINVDNFDWSLPGGLDKGPDGNAGTQDDRLLNGGILIWHIDEGVIESRLNIGGVNSNPLRRGIDLEEADGAQDIGSDISASVNVPAGGTPFDFWWKGNNASVITSRGDTVSFYENRFSNDTRPSNRSNSGSPSFFEFYAFSPIQPVANFQARRVPAEGIEPVALPVDTLPDQQTSIPLSGTYLNDFPTGLQAYYAQNDTFLIIPTPGNVYALQLDETGNTALFDFGLTSAQQPYIGSSVIIGEQPGSSNGISINSWNWTGTSWQNSWNVTGASNSGFLSSLDDNVLLLDLTPERFRIQDGSPLPDLPSPELRSPSLNNQYASLTNSSLKIIGSNFEIPFTPEERSYTGAVQIDAKRSAFYLLTNDELILLEPGAENPVTRLVSNTNLGWPALADIDGDNRTDFIYVNYDMNRIEAVNIHGAMVNYFPILPPKGGKFSGTPLVADIQDDGTADLLVSVQDSLSLTMYSYNNQGKQNTGFPLLAGSVSDSREKMIHPLIENSTLYTLDHKGLLKAWKISQMSNVQWKSRYGNTPYNKITGTLQGTGQPAGVNNILEHEETYNWPNPADNYTYIRYLTSDAGDVEIKIINLEGRVMYNRTFSTRGGSPEEQRISTEHWGNGVYLAQVTATVNGQKSSKLIKIAVIH